MVLNENNMDANVMIPTSQSDLSAMSSIEVLGQPTEIRSESLPQLSLLNDRFGELANVSPVISFFKTVVDPVVVVCVLFVLARSYNVAWDGYLLVLAVISFLLSSHLLDGVFLFVPDREGTLTGLARLLLGWLYTVALLVLLGHVSRFSAYYDLEFIYLWFAITPVALVLTHIGFRQLFVRMNRDGHDIRKVVIVGASRLGRALAQRVQENTVLGMEFVGYFDDRGCDRLEVKASEHLGDLNSLPEFVKKNSLHNIYVTLPMTSQPRVIQLVEALKDSTASIYFVPDLFVFDLIQARFDHVAGIPVVAVCETPFTGMRGVLKRVADIILSLVILLMIWPVMLAIAVAVKMTSPGPVLFKQRRYGLDGENILVYKFRSMTVCEDGQQIVQAQRNDSRLTSIGAFLRKTSLDELPQFINVLEGKMSIVGPRPHANAHNELYRKLIRGYMMRHKVKPGITGWAQVNGYRGETETVEKMRARIEYDLDYLRNWSLWLDLKIIFRTVAMIVHDKNAY